MSQIAMDDHFRRTLISNNATQNTNFCLIPGLASAAFRGELQPRDLFSYTNPGFR